VTRPALLACALALAACADDVTGVRSGALELLRPADGLQLFVSDPLALEASAYDTLLVKSVSLSLGDVVVKTCTANPPAERLDCAHEVTPADVAAQVKNESLQVTARAIDGDDGESTKLATVVVTSLAVNFVAPGPTVKGTSPVELSVKSVVPVTSLEVTYDDGRSLRSWVPDAATTTYEADVAWAALVGLGAHPLVATAQDASGRSSTARLTVDVLCAATSDCDVGQSCDTATGRCR
jgi:hypothetical protein